MTGPYHITTTYLYDTTPLYQVVCDGQPVGDPHYSRDEARQFAACLNGGCNPEYVL